MRRLIYILILLLFPGGTMLLTASANAQEPERKRVDFRSDVMRPIKITPDSTAQNLLGNVVIHHNGAIITCDSAVRYSERYIECFKRVVINQESTYVYGDRADYNGELNHANVYAPIIKVVSDSSVLYTYNFTFNTLDKVGEYYGTGTLTQGENMMESDRGYYYVDTREVVGVNDVQLSNNEYKMKSDSVLYNMDTETAEFFSTTYVWNDKGDILIADRGMYFNSTADYKFTSNAYILTENQEVWADTLDYNSRTENVFLRHNIQIRDEENSVMAFGDYGEYWGQTEYGMLTRDPSLISFDPNEADTLYMRSDSMFFYTFDIDHVFESSLLPGAAKQTDTAMFGEERIETAPVVKEVVEVEADGEIVEENPEEEDVVAEEITTEEEVEEETGTEIDAEVGGDIEDAEADDAYDEVSPVVEEDTIPLNDSLTVAGIVADSLTIPLTVQEPVQEDTTQRVIFAYNDVRIFREDFQAVCDSLVAFSKDSTAHLYIDPVLWNDRNQVTADIIDMYTRDEKLYKAEFTGNPFMASEIDTVRYNQIKGKFMTAWFRDNEIYRHEVKGNGQTHYYMEDDDENPDGSKDLMGFLVAESADIFFMIEERQIDKIIYDGEPVYTIYPMDKIPGDLEELLPGFKWESKRRPVTKEDVFAREVRPSVRENVENTPQPDFPITQSIMGSKERMIQQGVWRDRNDTISPLAMGYVMEWQAE